MIQLPDVSKLEGITFSPFTGGMMTTEPDFEQLINRVFEGDPQAATELVRQYEPEIRRVIRFRLRDPRLRRVIDTADICQSVFARFFFRAGLGQFDLNSPQDLIRLLSVMATNRLIDQHRREETKRKSTAVHTEKQHRLETGQLVDPADSPESIAEYKELLSVVRDRLSKSSLQISDWRVSGQSWAEIAERMGERSETVRKRFERDCERVFSEMGIDS